MVLIAALLLALIAISPNPGADGIEISAIESGSEAALSGLQVSQEVLKLNGEEIKSIEDFTTISLSLSYPEQEITVKTTKEEVTYTISNDIGFEVDENLTITYTEQDLTSDSTLLEINGEIIDDFDAFYRELIPKKTITVETNEGTFAYITRNAPAFSVQEQKTSNIALGLDFVGGTRVLLQPVSEEEITDQDIDNLIDVLGNRLNVYGLSDIKIRSAQDWEGNKFVLVELAGVTEREVQDLISQQGKFEAKIGDEIAFIGGQEDIPYVCRNDGSCSGIRACSDQGGQSVCTFEFQVTLSEEAAQRQADITAKLDVVPADTAAGNSGNYLSEPIDFYLDGELVDSLQIAASLKGTPSTRITISGPGYGLTQNDAIDDATLNMNQMQTVLITGSLPFDLEVLKIDTVSPVLGEAFIKNILLVGFIAVLSVVGVLFIRYRTYKVVVPIFLILCSELVIILGFAALVRWNLDMAAIAGIIAAIGTGVDDQIVILDETINNKEARGSWKDKLKRAFFIIFVAYATTVAAMIPLWNAGAGLIRGFALTTIVGVTIGVFLTRPAFASIVENLYKKD
jgi:preprotein translocase subunit SecD